MSSMSPPTAWLKRRAASVLASRSHTAGCSRISRSKSIPSSTPKLLPHAPPASWPMSEPSLADRLIGGDRRSVGTADTIASEVLRHNERFGELFEAMLHEDPVVRERASDAVEKL